MISPELAALSRPGRTLLGKYEVERVIGEGGMGVVVRALHSVLREPVAIKLLADGATARDERLARFLREARAAARLRSEHVARIFDAGTLPEGVPYIVMELASGRDLAAMLQQRGPLPIVDAVDHVLQACEALAEAHALGIVHRDIKPANLFLTRRPDGSPSIKVLDFGVSKLAEGDDNLTGTSAPLGSPMYMSPEQIRDAKRVDARADLWSLGVTLHQLLTGRAPFRAESAGALFMAIGGDPAEPLRVGRPDAPEALEQVILRCLEKRPERRYESCAALAEALAPFGSEAGALAARRAAVIAPRADDPSLASTLHDTTRQPGALRDATTPAGSLDGATCDPVSDALAGSADAPSFEASRVSGADARSAPAIFSTTATPGAGGSRAESSSPRRAPLLALGLAASAAFGVWLARPSSSPSPATVAAASPSAAVSAASSATPTASAAPTARAASTTSAAPSVSAPAHASTGEGTVTPRPAARTPAPRKAATTTAAPSPPAEDPSMKEDRHW